MMKRNNYVRPMMRSVEMRHKPMMQLNSPGGLTPTNSVSAGRNSYGTASKSFDTSPGSGFSVDGNGRWVWN